MSPVQQLGLLKLRNLIVRPRSRKALIPIFLSLCVISQGSWALGAEQSTNQAKSAGPPKKSVLRKFETPELDDPGLRDYLRAKLAMAERQRARIKDRISDRKEEIEELDERISEYKEAIKELSERIAKGPTASERFASMFDRYLDSARQRSPKLAKEGVQLWTMELDALLDALRGATADGVSYFNADFTLTPAHAALEIKGVKIETLLPYARREIADAPTATARHGKYLRCLIVCAVDDDEDGENLKKSLRYFQLEGMDRERKRFQAEVETLRNSVRRSPSAALPKTGQGTKPETADGDRAPTDGKGKSTPLAPAFE